MGRRECGVQITSITLKRMHALYAEGKNDRQIADAVGCSIATVHKWRTKAGLPVTESRAPSPPRMYYTIYDAKTNELLASGSAKLCARMLGMSMSSFYTIMHRARHGMQQKYTVLEEPYKADQEVDGWPSEGKPQTG